jgi:hypothetical protein
MAYYTIGIDPGFGGTGLALFRGNHLYSVVWLRKVGKRPFEERAHLLAINIRDWLEHEMQQEEAPQVGIVGRPLIVCEIPGYQNTPSRSMGWKKGDLQKLTYLVGAIGQACATLELCDDPPLFPVYSTVTPAGWKGQLSKEIVINRIRKRMPDVDEKFSPKLDVWDAIGIGLWAMYERPTN